MSLVTFPPEVTLLLGRWQAAQNMTDITNQLVDETRVLFTVLTVLPDQRTQITNLTEQIRQLSEPWTMQKQQKLLYVHSRVNLRLPGVKL